MRRNPRSRCGRGWPGRGPAVPGPRRRHRPRAARLGARQLPTGHRSCRGWPGRGPAGPERVAGADRAAAPSAAGRGLRAFEAGVVGGPGGQGPGRVLGRPAACSASSSTAISRGASGSAWRAGSRVTRALDRVAGPAARNAISSAATDGRCSRLARATTGRRGYLDRPGGPGRAQRRQQLDGVPGVVDASMAGRVAASRARTASPVPAARSRVQQPGEVPGVVQADAAGWPTGRRARVPRAHLAQVADEPARRRRCCPGADRGGPQGGRVAVQPAVPRRLADPGQSGHRPRPARAVRASHSEAGPTWSWRVRRPCWSR